MHELCLFQEVHQTILTGDKHVVFNHKPLLDLTLTDTSYPLQLRRLDSILIVRFRSVGLQTPAKACPLSLKGHNNMQ